MIWGIKPLTVGDPSSTDTTHDALFDGALALHQPSRRAGYRVNVDALLLAAFAACVLAGSHTKPRTVKHAFDLGSGVGAVGLSLLHFGAAAHVTMIEVDLALAALATRNAEANALALRIDVVHGDVRDAAKTHASKADLVVCNPPYVTPGRGHAPSERVRGAKYGDLGGFVDAARKIAGRRARVCFVYPAIEMSTLLASFRDRGLEAKRLCAVHAHAEDPARVVLVECAAGKPGGLVIEAPFIEMIGTRRSPSLTALLSMKRSSA